jgi:uncharacterized BrkB/YihY/UPF0761 family membrane protein
MFKKRIVADISLTRTPKTETDLDNEIAQVVGESAANIINGVVEDLLRPVAKIVVVSIVTVTVVSAACKIAVKTTHNN